MDCELVFNALDPSVSNLTTVVRSALKKEFVTTAAAIGTGGHAAEAPQVQLSALERQ